MAELLNYFSLRLRGLIATVKKKKGDRITLDQRQWQNLLDLQARLGGYLTDRRTAGIIRNLESHDGQGGAAIAATVGVRAGGQCGSMAGEKAQATTQGIREMLMECQSRGRKGRTAPTSSCS